MCGALMMLTGKWIGPGVYTVEEFDPIRSWMHSTVMVCRAVKATIQSW